MTLHKWPGHFVVRGGCANWWYLSARCISFDLHLTDFCIRHFEIPFSRDDFFILHTNLCQLGTSGHEEKMAFGRVRVMISTCRGLT